jgi:hypothetical protein
MAKIDFTVRWGLGSRIDPHFDARVGRAVFERPSNGAATPSHGTGYIELVGDDPYDDLKMLITMVHDPLVHGETLSPLRRMMLSPMRRMMDKIHSRPTVWKQICGLRYLTTDASTGLALPLADFNPDRKPPAWPKNASRQLANALSRLDRVAGKELKSASLIGLTVELEFQVIAEELKSMLPNVPRSGSERAKQRELRSRMERIQYGGLHPWLKKLRLPLPSVQRDAQDIALSGSLNPQLMWAMADLSDIPPATAFASSMLDYGIQEAGRGVIVGVVDFGCDFAHSSFRKGLQSRILALWDQNDGPEASLGSNPIVTPEAPVVKVGADTFSFGYGRVFTKAHIDKVLGETPLGNPENVDAPYVKLGYHPHDHHYTSVRPGSKEDLLGAHGTSVLELAAGCRRESCRRDEIDPPNPPRVAGVAPEADIVFVQVRTHEQSDGRKVLDANDVVDAVAYIFHIADARNQPCVVNLSLNTMSGPHDGDGHFERRLSALLKSGRAGPLMKGRAVTIAAGNLPDHRREKRQWQHIAGKVLPSRPFEFYWLPPGATDKTRNSVEIWYDAADVWLQVTLVSPTCETFGPINPGLAAELSINGRVCGSIIGSRSRPRMVDQVKGGQATQPLPGPSDDHVQGRNVILLVLDPVAAAMGAWKAVLSAVDKSDGGLPPDDPRAVAFHAWLERDDEGQSGISRASPPKAICPEDRASTIGTLSCGDDAIVVGAYDTQWSPAMHWWHSAHGPPRNASVGKPDISAPGVSLLLINSTRDKLDRRGSIRDGTSLAAPLVAGTIACLYEIDPQAELSTIKSALFDTARTSLSTGTNFDPQLGHGRLNPRGAVAFMRNAGETEDA